MEFITPPKMKGHCLLLNFIEASILLIQFFSKYYTPHGCGFQFYIKVTPPSINPSKRLFSKKIILLYLLRQIYTKITKNMSILKFWPKYPPFLRNDYFLHLGSPVTKSDTPAYLRSLKMLQIDFSSQNTCTSKFLGHFDYYFRI